VCHTLYSLEICFAPSLSDSLLFLTLTRLVVVINFVNFSFTLFTPPLGDFQSALRSSLLLFGHPERRSLSLLPERASASHQGFCRPAGPPMWGVVRTCGGGTGVPFVMAP
jgi:hypothetical protein